MEIFVRIFLVCRANETLSNSNLELEKLTTKAGFKTQVNKRCTSLNPTWWIEKLNSHKSLYSKNIWNIMKHGLVKRGQISTAPCEQVFTNSIYPTNSNICCITYVSHKQSNYILA